MNEARFWQAAENGAARCALCPRRCLIREGAAGACGIRENAGGKLYAATYGKVSAVALDPVEKKPLYLFHPGKRVLSVGGFGCNFHCPFCQNHDISIDYRTRLRSGETLPPERLAALAAETVPDGNIGVAYTYNEPLIGFEYLYDCAVRVRDAGLRNVVVTNGYISREPLETLLPYIDAMNVDLKGFSEGFYHTLGGGLDAVKDTIALAAGRCHLEITTLVIPGENEDDVEPLAGWLASIDPGIPLHLARFLPRHRYSDREPTPPETVLRLAEAARGHLKHVFAGNMR